MIVVIVTVMNHTNEVYKHNYNNVLNQLLTKVWFIQSNDDIPGEEIDKSKPYICPCCRKLYVLKIGQIRLTDNTKGWDIIHVQV